MSDLQPKTVHIYRRVSKAEKHSHSVSLTWQEQVCQAWVNAQPGLVMAEHVVDDGVSAGIHMRSRPQGKLLAKDAVAGDVVLVARLDRAFRDVLDFRETLSRWGERDISLVSATEPYELHTPSGLLAATIMVATSEYERHIIGERVAGAKATRRAAGLRADAEPPYGFRHVISEDKSAANGMRVEVVPDPEERSAAHTAWRLRMEGLSWGRIAKELDREKIKPRHSKRWSRHSVRLIVEAWEKGQGDTNSKG